MRSSWSGESRQQGKQRRGQSQVEDTRPHTHAVDALRQLTIHISTNDLHCCKPAHLLQLAPSGGRPRSSPLATAPPRITPPRHSPSTPARGPPRTPTPRPSPQPPPPPSQSQGQIPIMEQNFHLEPTQGVSLCVCSLLKYLLQSVCVFYCSTHYREMMLFIGT